jgi:hypothetical protein
LSAKQLNIFRCGCKTTIFWIQSLIKKTAPHFLPKKKKMTVTATKIDSSHESGKNVITWAWPASTTINYNYPCNDRQYFFVLMCMSGCLHH